ncbi:hypothetical protein ACFSCX_09680 [Bacillus salitolerans]|uniref:Uncharacterized protein n=1 Tax=Bacillus salitolerans TaxID=1437434 RepID=A0ABW4LNY8_9BACI
MLKSEYCDVEHQTILIDDTPLDILLHQNYPSELLLGLIPLIMDWVDNLIEREFIKVRYKSKNEEFVLPILMCPDDCDLWCTVIVAHVVRTNEYIIWDKIGIDRSSSEELLKGYDCIGSRVEWLDKIPQMKFDVAEYYTQLDKIYR